MLPMYTGRGEAASMRILCVECARSLWGLRGFPSTSLSLSVMRLWPLRLVVPGSCTNVQGNLPPVVTTCRGQNQGTRALQANEPCSNDGKLLEGILRGRICNGFEKTGIILSAWHCAWKSCLTNLIDFFLKQVTKKIDEGNAVDSVYMDFSKVFDQILQDRQGWNVRYHGVMLS